MPSFMQMDTSGLKSDLYRLICCYSVANLEKIYS